MPSKTEEYLALAQRTANGLTRYWESWTDYLTTASRLYKYPFADQLMIYAQRPDATACADFDIWNNRMNRYVRRGSKGIALLDESSGYPRLHYVFDVSDTGVRRNSRDPDLWQYNDDLKQPVSDALTAAYGISHERVSQQLADIAGKLVADYWDNNSEDIRYTCYGKLRKQTNCTGQTGYTVHILDEIIDKAVRQIFSKMRGIPKEQIVTKRYEKETTERKNHLQDLQTQRDKAEKDLLSLKAEILACIKGESVLPRETLAEMITEQEEKLKELEDLCESASEELERTAELMDKVSRLYDELISYADLYDSANFEAKKMVVNQLIRRVDVYRGYQINISFNFDLTPYIEGE